MNQNDSGYAMAVLLVAMSVMAILMTAAMPVWKQVSRREKEAELVFRGEQIARAIGLYQRKNGPGALPPSVSFLVEQRFLRRKYQDPITNEDFVPLMQSVNVPGQRGNAQPGAPNVAVAGARGGAPTGGMIGVTSKSEERSIRLYKGRSHYNEWQFVFTAPTTGPGGQSGAPGQRGRGAVNPQNPFGTPFAPPTGR